MATALRHLETALHRNDLAKVTELIAELDVASIPRFTYQWQITGASSPGKRQDDAKDNPAWKEALEPLLHKMDIPKWGTIFKWAPREAWLAVGLIENGGWRTGSKEHPEGETTKTDHTTRELANCFLVNAISTNRLTPDYLDALQPHLQPLTKVEWAELCYAPRTQDYALARLTQRTCPPPNLLKRLICGATKDTVQSLWQEDGIDFPLTFEAIRQNHWGEPLKAQLTEILLLRGRFGLLDRLELDYKESANRLIATGPEFCSLSKKARLTVLPLWPKEQAKNILHTMIRQYTQAKQVAPKQLVYVKSLELFLDSQPEPDLHAFSTGLDLV